MQANKIKIIHFFGICVIILVSLVWKEAECLDISVTNNWNRTIDKNDLATGVGSDLNGIYESITNVVTVDISGCTGDSDNWRVDIKRTDSTWHNDFTTYVKRSSDGTGNGSILSGTTYLDITQTDQAFFSGSGNRSSIDMQYKLIGMSLGVSPNTYSTTIVYTVVDTP